MPNIGPSESFRKRKNLPKLPGKPKMFSRHKDNITLFKPKLASEIMDTAQRILGRQPKNDAELNRVYEVHMRGGKKFFEK